MDSETKAETRIFYACGGNDSDYVTTGWCESRCDFFDRGRKVCKEGAEIFLGIPADEAQEFLEGVIEYAYPRSEIFKKAVALLALLPKEAAENEAEV